MNYEKQLRRYIIPNIFAMVGMSCYILADTFFISQAAGSNGITALNLTLPIYSLIFAFGSMIGMGFATRYALLKEGSPLTAQNMFSYAIEWEILISLIFVCIGILCPDMALRLMGADDEIVATGTRYLRIALLFAPCFMLNYTFTAFVRNDHSPKIAMTATISSSLFNIIFDYLLIFPFGMGMAGAALATGLSPIVSILICMTHYLSKKNILHFHPVRPSIRLLFDASRTGMAYFIGEMASGITTAAFNYILLGLAGNVAVAAYGVIANIAMVASAIFNGITQGQQPVLSELYAQNNKDGVRRVQKHAIQIAFGIAVLLIIGIFAFADTLAGIFNSEGSAALQLYAVSGLRIYFVGYLFAAINIINTGYYSAVDQPRRSFAIAITRGVVAIVLFVFLLSRIWGSTGVWLAFPVTELFTLLVSSKTSQKHFLHS